MPLPLRPPCARTVRSRSPFYTCSLMKKASAAPEKLAQLFEIKQILVPDTVYYPAKNAAFYDFSYVGVLPSGSFTVTDGGETVTVTVNGTKIYLETKHSTSLSHDTDILVTEKPQSAGLCPDLRF